MFETRKTLSLRIVTKRNRRKEQTFRKEKTNWIRKLIKYKIRYGNLV